LDERVMSNEDYGAPGRMASAMRDRSHARVVPSCL
jgi:hypothetical protein